MTSSVMDGFLHVPMKNEIVAHNNKLDTCIRKRFDAFILKIKVGIICGGVGFDDKIIWKPWHLVPTNSLNLDFNGGSR